MQLEAAYPVSDIESKLIHDITQMGRSTLAWNEIEVTDDDVDYAIRQYAKHGTDITKRLVPIIGEDGSETDEHEWIDASDAYMRGIARFLVISEMLFDLHCPQIEDVEDAADLRQEAEYSLNWQESQNEIERYRQSDLENVNSAKHLYRLMTGALPSPELREKLKVGLTPEVIEHLEIVAEALGFDTSSLT